MLDGPVVSPPAPPTITIAPRAPSTGYRMPRTVPCGVEISTAPCNASGSSGIIILSGFSFPITPPPAHPKAARQNRPGDPYPAQPQKHSAAHHRFGRTLQFLLRFLP